MITKADDYPVHQTSEPIAYSGTDPNFYDRYFFCGYGCKGEHYFAAALGVYPHQNVMDASFCLIDDGVQHNIHASRILNMERMNTSVGPISIEVVEPLKKLMLKIDENESGITAELMFEARVAPVEEPRFIRRNGPQTMFDYTRMTQNGAYEGWIDIKGKRIKVSKESSLGTRDRSWGVRPIGAPDSRPTAVPPKPQFYWLWAPLNFGDCAAFYAVNTDEKGFAWNESGKIALADGSEIFEASSAQSKLIFKKGTRHAKSAVIDLAFKDRPDVQIKLEPKFNFYMSGLGYLNQKWNHGAFKGKNVVGYDSIELAGVDENSFPCLHIQAFCEAVMTDDSGEKKGVGLLEQLIIGPHGPSGFKSILDPAT